MNVEEIKSIIKEQREDAENLMSRAIPRDVPKEELLTNLSIPNVLAILGVRRSGKSTLSLLLLRDKNFAYIDFDDERLRNVNYPALTDVASPPHDGDFLLLRATSIPLHPQRRFHRTEPFCNAPCGRGVTEGCSPQA